LVSGFAGSGTRKITQLAGVNNAAIAYHFGNKRGIFEALVEQVLGKIPAGSQKRQLHCRDIRVCSTVRCVVEVVINSLGSDPQERVHRARIAERLLRDEDPSIQNTVERIAKIHRTILGERTSNQQEERRRRVRAFEGFLWAALESELEDEAAPTKVVVEWATEIGELILSGPLPFVDGSSASAT
jgi:AcrR family transcriptional regulator